MDTPKDIQQRPDLSSFFEKQPLGESLALQSSVDRLYRRAERIVAALFLATNHIHEEEALRIRMRSAGLQMLKDALALRHEMRSPQSAHASTFRASARYIVSLLRMLSVSGFLSIQNATVLIEALDDLGNFLRSAQQSALSENIAFSRQDFLDISHKPLTDIKDRAVKDNIKVSDTTTRRSMNVRKENILEILRTSGELSVSQIAAGLPEYSAKMIQRDLVELISGGIVKKAGLKRWSRYSLAG